MNMSKFVITMIQMITKKNKTIINDRKRKKKEKQSIEHPYLGTKIDYSG